MSSPTDKPSINFEFPDDPSDFAKWQPTVLMEWAKSGYTGAQYNLAVSGVDHVRYSDLPGHPYEIVIDGNNVHGHNELRALIADWYGATPAHVLLAQGASQCNFLVAGAVLSGGGEAIIETPRYDPIYRSVAAWADRIHDLPRRPENGYLPDPAALKKLINSRTRLVCLTNLHNPTHVRMSAELIGEIVQMCRAENVFLMIDEAYLPFVERAHHKHAFAGGAISINSLCKAWGLSNLRVGWAVGDPAIIEKCYRLNNLLGVNQPYVTEHLAYQIMSRPDALSYLIARAEKAAAGRKYLHDFLAQTPEIICTPPAGGVSAWLKLPAGMDERKLISMLVLKFSTVCFPGFLFAAPGHIRVSYGSDPARMQTGFQNLRSALQECA